MHGDWREVRLILYSQRTEPRSSHLTEPATTSSSWRMALLCVMLAATVAVTPMIFGGNISGHDFQFHIGSWMDVAGQWREGVLYPRWAEWANFGFGEPRFVFYPPASWMLGAAIGSALPWKMAPGAFDWLALVAAGLAMFRLAREWIPGWPAVVAAVVYAVNPYSLVIVYFRSDFAELLAIAFLPLLILKMVQLTREGWRHVPLLAAAFAAIWLSNAPAAVIATYSLAVMLVVGGAVRRSLRPLIAGGFAMAGGFCLAAFYILPAAYERRWVQIGQVVSANLGPARNFLFTHSNDAEFMAFNWKVSSVAVGMMIVTAIAAFFAAKRRGTLPELWWVLVALGAVAAMLMVPVSVFLWRHLPELVFVQFPWRWLDVLAVAFALFTAAAISTLGERRAAWLATSLVLGMICAAAAVMVNNAWWDVEDIPGTASAIQAHRGFEGTEEYAPVGADRYQLPGNPDDDERPPGVSPNPAPDIAKYDASSGELEAATGIRLHTQRKSAEHWAFTADTSSQATLALRLLNFPAWRVQVDGNMIRHGSYPETGQMLVPLDPGEHRVEIRFRRTWDRAMGIAISGITALVLLAWAALARRREEMGSAA